MNKKFRLFLKRIQPSVDLCPDFWRIVESKSHVVPVTVLMPIGTDTSTTDCVPYFRLATTITTVRVLLHGKKYKTLSIAI